MHSKNSRSKAISLFLSLTLILTTAIATTTSARADIDSWFKAWTTVGSAGTIDEADTAKLVMQGSTISFPESLLPLPAERFGNEPSFAFPSQLETVAATVRYNVVATDGLFENGAYLGMKSRLRDDGDRAQVVLRLYEVNIDTGATSLVMTLDSNSFTPSGNYQTVGASVFVGNRINFQQNAYFIEATLVQKRPSITPIGAGRPGIAVIQLQRFTPIL